VCRLGAALSADGGGGGSAESAKDCIAPNLSDTYYNSVCVQNIRGVEYERARAR
jgi:hypothetical protein